MQVIEHLAKAKSTLITFEVLQQLKNRSICYRYECNPPVFINFLNIC